MRLEEISAFLFEACCLYEDSSIDPDDHASVIDAAFLTSDCDDLAWVLSKVTGWPAVTLTWNMGRNVGSCLTGHHSLVKAPDGRYLDISGWTDVSALARRAKVEPRLIAEHEFRHHPFNFTEFSDDEHLAVILAAGPALGREPFTEDWFSQAVEGYRAVLAHMDEEHASRIAPSL